ncbi:MAG: hypothetical protein AB7K86_14595, partial [Rhodospirillales bacterium]
MATALGNPAADKPAEIVLDKPAPPRAARKEAPTPLAAWRALARRNIAAVVVFSVAVNVLMLTLPIYLFQISDRVLTSRSLDTLLMLSALALGFLLVLWTLDVMRRQVLGRIAGALDAFVAGPVLAGIV